MLIMVTLCALPLIGSACMQGSEADFERFGFADEIMSEEKAEITYEEFESAYNKYIQSYGTTSYSFGVDSQSEEKEDTIINFDKYIEKPNEQTDAKLKEEDVKSAKDALETESDKIIYSAQGNIYGTSSGSGGGSGQGEDDGAGEGSGQGEDDGAGEETSSTTSSDGEEKIKGDSESQDDNGGLVYKGDFDPELPPPDPQNPEGSTDNVDRIVPPSGESSKQSESSTKTSSTTGDMPTNPDPPEPPIRPKGATQQTSTKTSSTTSTSNLKTGSSTKTSSTTTKSSSTDL